MARLRFPDAASVDRVQATAGTALLSAAGAQAVVYLSAAGVQLADDLLDADGNAVTNGTFLLDSLSRMPSFYGPTSGQEQLWLRVDGGDPLLIEAQIGSRLDALAAEIDEFYTAKRVTALNVLDFGAIGDGLTDDTAAVIAALAAARDQNRPLYVPEGDYLTGSTLEIAEGVDVFGDGHDSLLRWVADPGDYAVRITGGNSSLRKMQLNAGSYDLSGVVYAAHPAALVAASGGATLNPATDRLSDVTVEGCRIVSTATTVSGVVGYIVDRFTARDNYVSAPNSTALLTIGIGVSTPRPSGVGTVYSYDGRIENNEVIGFHRGVGSPGSGNRSRLLITGNRVTGCADTGIWGYHVVRGLIADNLVSDCDFGGIFADSARDETDLFASEAAAGTQVVDNRVHRCGSTALLRTVTDAVITLDSKTLTSATANFTAADVGFQVLGLGLERGSSIKTVTNSTTVEMSDAANATATGVTVNIANASYGIIAEELDNGVISGNVVTYSGADAIRLGGGTRGTLVDGNTVHRSGANGIVVNRSYNPVTSYCADNVISNNVVRLSTGHGIAIQGAQRSTLVQGNTVTDNGLGGHFRSITDGSITSGSATFTSATAAFTAADVGRSLAATGIPSQTTILTFNSATSVTMSANATVTNAATTVGIYTLMAAVYLSADGQGSVNRSVVIRDNVLGNALTTSEAGTIYSGLTSHGVYGVGAATSDLVLAGNYLAGHLVSAFYHRGGIDRLLSNIFASTSITPAGAVVDVSNTSGSHFASGNVGAALAGVVGGTVTAAGAISGGLITGGLDARVSTFWTVQQTGNITSLTISNGIAGQDMTIVFVSNGTARTITAASTIKLASTLPTSSTTAGTRILLRLTYDGTNWLEVARQQLPA